MAQPPPTKPEVATIAMNAVAKLIVPGAKNNPRAQVKITSDDRRGLVSENRSKIIEIFLSGMAMDETVVVVIFLVSLLNA